MNDLKLPRYLKASLVFFAITCVAMVIQGLRLSSVILTVSGLVNLAILGIALYEMLVDN